MPVLSPDQFLARIGKQPLAPAYLFVGPEGYHRRRCREALTKAALPPDSPEDAFERLDLEECALRDVLDTAKALSLFTRERVVWASSAELALPRRLSADSDESGVDALLENYVSNPTQGTVLVFECSRFDFSGDDRAKVERVQKFFAKIPFTVEFRPLAPEAVRALAQQLIKEHGLRLAGAELAALLDAVGGDATRLAGELEKLALFVGKDRPVTSDDLRAMVPSAAQSTVFELVNALGKRDRSSALRSLDILVREGEYLPLALTFLSAQFRLALAAKEARVTNGQQALSLFNRMGVRIWRERAEQVMATAAAFSHSHLLKAVDLVYETDKNFREGYKDDRLVMERLVLALTA